MNKNKINEIMEETCFESLAYCCSLEKSCPIRDGVIKKLGLTKKDFMSLKETFNNNLHLMLKGGKNEL